MGTITKSLFILFVSISAFAADASSNPKVFFEYGYPFDLMCPQHPQKPINEEMQNELFALIPMVDQLWAKESVALLGTTVATFNKGFDRTELSATLILCHTTPSMSHPLLINMRKFLKSAWDDPRPQSYLVSLIFHEILHRYLSENFDSLYSTSTLLKKYQSESGTVLAHLHLMAVQKYVYVQLNREAELKQTITWDSMIPNPGYKRSWEIIGIEGYQPFIDELLQSK